MELEIFIPLLLHYSLVLILKKFQLYIGDVFKLVDILEGNVVDYYNKDPPTSFIEFKDFWISWHSGKFQYGLCPNIEPMRCIKLPNAKKIGFVSFHIPTIIDEAEVRWVIESKYHMIILFN